MVVMKKIHTFGVIWLFSLSVCLVSNLSRAENVSESEVRKIENEARKKELESKKLQAQAIQLNLEMSKIDKNLISLAKKIQDNEESLFDLETKKSTLENDLKQKEEAFLKENKSLVSTIASLQNMSLNPSESIILQPLSPIDIIRSAILLREAIPYLSDKSSKLKVDLDNIYQQKLLIDDNVEETKKQSLALEKKQKEMKGLLAQKTSLRKNVEKKGAETKKVAEHLTSKAKDLRELLEEIERQKEIARKKLEEEQRKKALAEEKKQKVVDTKTHEIIKKQTDVNRFVKAKGLLSRPVRGSIITEYGQIISNGVSSKGIVYKTRPNAQVVAPYDGTVIFSGPFKGYGNLIIIEHGGGYLSLLAGLGHIDCELGQMLLAGEPVGTMADDTSSKLYVEIRKDRQPINPAPWIAD